MKVEVLFPEICNLYGELENIKYLKKSCPHIEVIETAINDRPLLVSETPDIHGNYDRKLSAIGYPAIIGIQAANRGADERRSQFPHHR